jgi:hypothetical protein
LNYYYCNREELQMAGEWCHDRVHQERFTWPFIQKQMLDIIESLLHAPVKQEFKGFGTPAKIL